MSVEELFEDGGSRGADHSTELGRGKGREIDEIPLCGQCVEEVSRETAKDDHLIPMALRRVDRYDGGLSRRRWEEATGQSSHEDHSHETPSSLSSHPELEHQTGIFGTSAGSKGKHVSRTPSPIYVSMHDPLGEPAFRRSETKPIPKWMQYLPSKRSDELDCVERPSSVLDDYFSPPDSSAAESDTESGIRQSPSPPPVPAHIIPVRKTTPQTNKEHSKSTEELAIPKPSTTPPRSNPVFVSEPTRAAPAFKTVQMSRPFTFIDEKPGRRPSSRIQPGRPSPSRHVRFISPPKTTSSPTFPSGSVSHTKSPSESSEYLDRHVPQGTQGKSSILLPSGLRDTNLSVTTPFVKRYTGGGAGPSAKTVLRSLGDQSCSTDLSRGSADVEGLGLGKMMRTKHHESAAQRKFHGGGDGAVDSGSDRRPGRAITFQDQLKRVLGFS